MDETQHIKLAKTFLRINRGVSKEPIYWYRELQSSEIFQDFKEILEPYDLIILSFLIPNLKSEKNIHDFYNNIKTNIFTFSVIDILDKNPTIECYECSGSGSGDCSECGNTGESYCEYCDGSGEDSDGVCDACEGDGTIVCDACRGTGESYCEYCDGEGEVYINETEIDETNYISINKNLFSILEIKNEFDVLDSETISDIHADKNTLPYWNKISTTPFLSKTYQEGESVFYDLSFPIEPTKDNNGRFKDDNLYRI